MIIEIIIKILLIKIMKNSVGLCVSIKIHYDNCINKLNTVYIKYNKITGQCHNA